MPALRQILAAAQMQAAEQALIEAGDTVESLMERAGAGAADFVWRIAAGRPVTVLCGPGNNGGDGYVIARVLAERGCAVSVVAPLEPGTDAAKAARAAWGGEPVDHANGAVFVDCLFGTGLARPLSAPVHRLLGDLAASHDLNVAVDLPSGVDSDSGARLNENLPCYDLTIALGAWKRAHWLMPAAARMGSRKLVDIGIAPVRDAAVLAPPPRLTVPGAQAHKYTRGLLAVVGGAMPGAAMLAARAAMHAGAGYVKLFAAHKSPMAPDELVVDDAPLDEALADARIAALLAGPGLGRNGESQHRLRTALHFNGPLVLDGDALMLLQPDMQAQREGPLVLTPHEGELRQLGKAFGIEASERHTRAAALSAACNAIVIAKGPDTLIAAPDEKLHVMPPAPSWLSIAGTGDVLAGLVASRLATGERAGNAAVAACHLHAEAARLAGPAFSAGTMIDCVPEAYAAFL